MEKYGLGTRAVRAGQKPDPGTGSCAVPIHMTTAFQFDSIEHARKLFDLEAPGYLYTRLGNPTNEVFEQRMAALDGGVGALALSSGQQAVAVSLLNLAKSGDHIISSTGLYGGTVSLFLNTFKRFGIEFSLVDMSDPENITAAVRKNTRAVFYETVANPKNEVLDYDRVACVAHQHGLPVICDNTTLTSILFSPFEHGADISVYSATKMIAGHGIGIGGVIVDSGNFDWDREPEKWPQFTAPNPSYHGLNFRDVFGKACFITNCRTNWLRDMGGCLSPMNAFLFLLGLETLHLRAIRHSETALKVAEYLEKHPKVSWVNYPLLPSHPNYENAKRYLPNGAGCIIGFGVKGGREAGRKFIESVELAIHLANICDAKTIVTHPATTTHSQLNEEELKASGVSADYIRLSVGLEDYEDIIADLDQALCK